MSIALASTSTDLLMLLECIERAIQTRTGGRVQDLRIKVEERSVVVSGKTSSYYNKQLVTQAVRCANPEMAVKNDVQVG